MQPACVIKAIVPHQELLPTDPVIHPEDVVIRSGVVPADSRLGNWVQQLTYEPGINGKKDGVRHLFRLVGITVAEGALDVGIRYADGNIAVYRNLMPNAWGLSEWRSDLDRATLEFIRTPDTPFVVKSLAIEPVDEPSDVSLQFVALGDTGHGNAEQRQVATAIENWCGMHKLGCDFALLLGDNIYGSGAGSCMDSQFNTKFEMPYQALKFPFHVVLGNHDYGNGGGPPFDWARAQNEVNYAKGVCTRPSSKWQMMGDTDSKSPSDRYYAFQRGNAQFLALDTTPMVAETWQATSPPPPMGRDRQEQYVKDQEEFFTGLLRRMGTQWQIAFGHHPYLSNGPHGNAGTYDGGKYTDANGNKHDCPLQEAEEGGWQCGKRLGGFIDTLCNEGLDLYLSGHDHSLQAFSAPCGTLRNNQVEFIVSGAGTRLIDSKGVEQHLTELPGQTPALFQQKKTLGFVVITAADSGRRLTVNIVDASSPTNPQALFTRRLFK